MQKLSETKELARYIEKLRMLRNISQEEFVDDIISLRQYRRYLNGETSLQMQVFIELAEKLNFKPEFLLLEFEAAKVKESQNINTLYNSVVNYDLENAEQLFSKIDHEHLIDDDDILLFNHSKNLYEFFKKQITETFLITKTKLLIDFDNIFKKRALTPAELLVLVSFFNIRNFKEHYLIAKRLTEYVNEQITVVSGYNIRTVILVFQQLSKYYGLIDDFDMVIEFTTRGINYSLSMRSNYLLDYLFYYLALACYKLGYIRRYNEALYRLYATLESEHNEAKTKKFIGMIEKAFKIDFWETIQTYIKENRK